MTEQNFNTEPSNSTKTVLCKVTLSDLKSRFEKWSGFTFKSENLEDACAEIESMKYQLECEISDYARFLRKMAEKSFRDE
jgi:hypothetical protein